MKVPRQIRIIAAILLAGAILLFARTGYVLMRPGSAEDLAGLVAVEGDGGENGGSFYLVTVTQQQASPLLFIYAVFAGNVDLEPVRQVIPPGMDQRKYDEMMHRWMEESQNLARVIAFRRAGFAVPVASDGVEIIEVGRDSPAHGILAANDIILAVDGKDVALADELINMVQLRRIGDPVTLRVKREGREFAATVLTASHPEDSEKAALRILVHTLNWRPQMPRVVEIDAGEITGPSAGLMFVLEILDQLEKRDLTAGRLIAGSGTINLKEQVGAVGGVRQKVAAAEKAGAEYFFVPRENYDEALTIARNIELVPISTLSEALDFLSALDSEN
jgi:PDZ domain-containing protein